MNEGDKTWALWALAARVRGVSVADLALQLSAELCGDVCSKHEVRERPVLLLVFVSLLPVLSSSRDVHPSDERARGARQQVALASDATRTTLRRHDRGTTAVRNHIHSTLATHGRTAETATITNNQANKHSDASQATSSIAASL